MDAFTVAAQLLGGLELDSGQLAQLRAINHEYHQRRYTLLHASDTLGVTRDPTPAELTELHSMLVTDIHGLLSPGQRGQIRGADDSVLAWEWEGGGPG